MIGEQRTEWHFIIMRWTNSIDGDGRESSALWIDRYDGFLARSLDRLIWLDHTHDELP